MKFRESQVSALLAAKREYDDAPTRHAAEKLGALVRDSTGHEINAAMDDSGQGTMSWARVRSAD